MADAAIPYVPSYGAITRALERVREAPTPERFTQDFLATKLGLKGGTPRPVIPFLKRTGFLNADGSPTELYRRFRNPAASGAAAAEAVRRGYSALYEVNEYVHELPDPELKGVVVQVAGLPSESSTVRAIVGSFKALRQFADFDAPFVDTAEAHAEEIVESTATAAAASDVSLRLGYTINLHLPATSDVAVFNAIFKSLRAHLLS
ncbi:MAG TPA: DUF5343 domain-containing protein [Solirubrobacteraceae bacterium]|nr:DUF5343 domain-containing protein [Solirubrobacteraceae bacterium]